MENIDTLLGFSRPLDTPDTFDYVYGGLEQYLDTSESQSPADSLYDMPYGAEPSSVSSLYSSPDRDEEHHQQPTQEDAQKPAAKRKRENRYKNAPPSVLSRRRAQNRASQRAYRERKDQRIKDLETMLQEAKESNDVLSKAYTDLHAEYVQLKMTQLDTTHLGQPQPYLHPATGLDQAVTGGGSMHVTDRLDLDMFVYSVGDATYAL